MFLVGTQNYNYFVATTIATTYISISVILKLLKAFFIINIKKLWHLLFTYDIFQFLKVIWNKVSINNLLNS